MSSRAAFNLNLNKKLLVVVADPGENKSEKKKKTSRQKLELTKKKLESPKPTVNNRHQKKLKKLKRKRCLLTYKHIAVVLSTKSITIEEAKTCRRNLKLQIKNCTAHVTT